MVLDDATQRYLASQRRGCLATVGLGGAPQNKLVGFIYNADLGTFMAPSSNMRTARRSAAWPVPIASDAIRIRSAFRPSSR